MKNEAKINENYSAKFLWKKRRRILIGKLVDIIRYWSTNAFAIRGECAFEYLMRRKARARIFTLGKPFRTFAGAFLRLRTEKHFF